MVRNKITHVGVVAAGAVLATVLAGCGSGSGSSASSTPSSPASDTSTPASSSSSATPSPAGSSNSATEPPAQASNTDGFCKAADVTLSFGQGDAAAGTVYRQLVITNSSGRKCIVQGFPGVSYVAGADGHQVGQAAVRVGTKGAAFTLNKGDSVQADIGFVQVANFEPATCRPTATNGLRIYLPQDTASKFIADPGTGCANTKIPGDQLTVKTVAKS
jgi:hypothetical protein